MAPKYKLSFKMRVVLLILRIMRGKSFDHMNLRRIKRLRRPVPSFFALYWILGRPAPVQVENRSIPVRHGEIPVRIYRPDHAHNLPLIMNFHGGGWTVGNLQNNDHYCSHLAQGANAIVISVDYRLAPEHPFPAAVEDAYDSFLWVHEHGISLGGDPARIGVTGDSAGGNLSAVMALMSRDLKGPALALQALIYPGTDGRLGFPSLQKHQEAPLLAAEDVHFFRNAYAAKEGDHLHPWFSPYLAENHSELAPALVITAGYDPLCDDGTNYAKKLREAGNEVMQLHYPQEIHGFMTFPTASPKAKEALGKIVEAFKERFGSGA